MRIALALLVLLAACSKKEDRPPAPPPPPPPRFEDAQVAATADARPPEPTPTCTTMLPQAIRDTYFRGATITPAPPSHGGEKCQIKMGDQLATLIEVACGDSVKAIKQDMIKSFRNTYENGKPLTGVGNPALVSTMENGQTVVYAWTADSACVVVGELPKGVEPGALLKDWLAQLPPK